MYVTIQALIAEYRCEGPWYHNSPQDVRVYRAVDGEGNIWHGYSLEFCADPPKPAGKVVHNSSFWEIPVKGEDPREGLLCAARSALLNKAPKRVWDTMRSWRDYPETRTCLNERY